MSAQIHIWPEIEIQKIALDLSNMRKRVFADQNDLAKEMQVIVAQVEVLTEVVAKIAERWEKE